ncbi:MAG TPA: DUF2807 domain-containing protein [Phenylobacterium sp.]|jgi:hypothetical protein|uniref:GIN domain-containing protein n=1 Tax=Phenylobacterium sp. TaxID=1871053 RepID=UPI002D2D21CC|nr:DUF2807 domain-containing protein [Phenylobacterium sp.]HZZ69629.1 DUF2807 domain-containing protein [Phenylobacterium sp.]
MRFAPLFAAAAVIAIAAPVAAVAQTVIPTEKFTAIDLHGGGTITIRQGPVQRVTLIDGDTKRARFEVVDRDHGGRLVMSPCDGVCFGLHRFEVEIETPVLNGVDIHGGGHITAHGAFPAQTAVSAEIHGGGDIDMKDVPAQSASAAIHGGGKIYVTAQNSLSAEIMGGGVIRYAGHPSVSSSIHGGGAVSQIP